MGKIETSMSAIEAVAPKLGDRVDIGTISFACAFGYLDLRFPDFGWRDRHPKSADWFAASAHGPRWWRRSTPAPSSSRLRPKLQTIPLVRNMMELAEAIRKQGELRCWWLVEGYLPV
jgi:hypothetical protein